MPLWSSDARTVVTRRQKRAALVAGAILVIALVVDARLTLVAVMTLLMLVYLGTSAYRLYLAWTGLRSGAGIQVSPEAVAAFKDEDLPRYTILIPLYKEISVLNSLTTSLGRLDYPADKLEIFLLLEEDDVDTIQAARERDLPPPFTIVVVPDGIPKSKPRACNYGLALANSEFTVIYDAEDQPDRDQLKKAIHVFRELGPQIGCVQGKLNYFNQRQNLLTRWFTAEYSMWFDFYLPGLDATNAPIPLGGTSNHFPTQLLRDLGGWDAFNMTEDADLGLRLARLGYSTAVVDSTTWEEATSRVGNWIRQRSRWIKGYAQTWLVLMRHPVALYRDLGAGRFWSFQATVGGTVFMLLLNPLFWLLAVLWYVTEWGGIEAIFPGPLFFIASLSFFFGNFAFAYSAMLACLHRKYFSLAKFALLVPGYWVLMSIAAWKGVTQLITKPFYWEKTTHGHFEPDQPQIQGVPAGE
jgi:cellulose synthase/poly-beta-1,6-N-acetylglucosamine synthase-like glycosyltransferase